MLAEPKPCPVCETDIDIGPTYDGDLILYDCECGYGSSTPSHTLEEAIKVWNETVDREKGVLKT